MAARVVFYYDFNSPYAYLAAERIDGLIPDAEWRPIAFAILLGQRGRLERMLEELDPAPVAVEVAERAAERGLPPFAPPPGWPFETWSLAPLRAALFADQRDRLREFSGAAYQKSFVESRSLAELDNVLAAAREAGLEPDEVSEAIQRPEIKERLKGHTDEALERGVNGIPTVAVGNELFWGDDRSRKPRRRQPEGHQVFTGKANRWLTSRLPWLDGLHCVHAERPRARTVWWRSAAKG